VAAPDPIPQLVQFLQHDSDIFSQGQKEAALGRAPARLDVMGGVSDITGGLVCTMPLAAASAVAVQRRDDRKLVIRNYNDRVSTAHEAEHRVELSLDDFYGTAALLPSATLRDLFTGGRHWAAYIAGVFPTLARHRKITRRTHGANIACFSNVPFGVGLGSSAAVVCATLSALTAAFQMLLDPLEIAVLSQKLEHQMVGVPRGVMDPAAAVLGKANHLLLMRCQPHEVQGYLPMPAGLLLAAINTDIAPPIGGPSYQKARVAAVMAGEMIARVYADFGIKKDPTGGYLANVSVAMFERYFRKLLPETITGRRFVELYSTLTGRHVELDMDATYHPRAAAEYHILENARTTAFVEKFRALGHGEGQAQVAAEAGRLMFESHTAYGTCLGLGGPATDAVVSRVNTYGPANGFYGARVMGVGGSVVVLATDTDRTRQLLEEIATECRDQFGANPHVVMGTSPGAAEVPAVKMPVAALTPRPDTAAG
jgi:L-arabinokinase